MSSFVFASAPCCWGIEDEINPEKMSWRDVFREIREAGYSVSEAGPYNYIPVDEPASKQMLDMMGVSVIAGTLLGDLVSESKFAEMTDRAEKVCSMLQSFGKDPALGTKKPKYLVIIDFAHDGRENTAGRSDEAKRLDAAERNRLYSHIRKFSEIAAKYGVRAVVHHHSGGFLEFEDEIDDMLASIPPKVAGLCADTGHFAYAGLDPVYAIDKYADRIEYVHFKDIDRDVYADSLRKKLSFREAAMRGAFRPTGEGCLDYPSIAQALNRINYEGYIVLEEDKDPRNADTSLEDTKRSLRFASSL